MSRPLLAGGALAGGAAVYYFFGSKDKQITEPRFVINGFYMSMRDKYVQPGAKIHYMLAEWNPRDLPWEEFRSKTLGETDPATAAPGSARRQCLDRWQELGLAGAPNVGDNSVHASASPFEAMAERLNWAGADVESDSFGAALLKAGVPKGTILDWTKDPQVPFQGKKGSLFDMLEDMDSDACLTKAATIAGANGATATGLKNEAFIFLKPHAANDKVAALVKKKLQDSGVKVTKEGCISGQEIDKKQMIDQHYYAIANKAALMKPKELNVPEPKKKEFEQKFGLTWEQAVADSQILNATDACKAFQVNGAEMDSAWAISKKAGKLVKLGGGFYAGLVDPATAKK